MSRNRSPRPTRRALLTTAGGAAMLTVLAACSGDRSGGGLFGGRDAPAAPQPAEAPPAPTIAADSIAMSQALLASAPVAVLVTPGSPYLVTASSLGIALGAPVLAADPDAIAGECARLGVETVVAYDAAVPEGIDAVAGPVTAEEATTLLGREITAEETAETDALARLAELTSSDGVLLATGPLAAVVLPEGTSTADDLAAPDPGPPSIVPAVWTGSDVADAPTLATAIAQGCTATRFPGPDPRRGAEGVAAAKQVGDPNPVAVGSSFGEADVFAARFSTATTVPEVPGGGQLIYPDRRIIALYGHPGSPVLGVLGEQDVEEAATRAAEAAAEYDDLTDLPVVPAFEIIATIASDSAGRDGDYSSASSVEFLQPWVDRAAEEGIFVVLDLQPGRTDFLTQAKLYEPLLKLPHVGLALDPEWRLEPDEVHLKKIGSVSAAEVNTVITWLADLVAAHSLPQKMLVLHQFRTSMITERETLDTSREELAVVLHADGQGGQGAKAATWNTLQTDLPEGIHLAWKNFHDEDMPMLDPAQTMAIEPQPVLVSYQ